MIWNTFDLNSGIWDQEFFSGGELKWTDKFNTSGTIWNYAKPILAVKQTRELPELINALEESTSAGAILIISALCLCLLVCRYV